MSVYGFIVYVSLYLRKHFLHFGIHFGDLVSILHDEAHLHHLIIPVVFQFTLEVLFHAVDEVAVAVVCLFILFYVELVVGVREVAGHLVRGVQVVFGSGDVLHFTVAVLVVTLFVYVVGCIVFRFPVDDVQVLIIVVLLVRLV